LLHCNDGSIWPESDQMVGSRGMDTPPDWRDEKSAAWAPERIVIGALVFAFGLLIGAGVAALLRPAG
jgi:hypothetical protein